MSKVIIGIHGLGNKPAKELLEQWWQDAIYEGLKGIGKTIFKPKFEMIYWADILHDKPLDDKITDKENPYYLEEKYTRAPQNFRPTPHPLRQKFLDYLEEQMDKVFLNDDLSLNYSAINDKIIHKYFSDLALYYTDTDDKVLAINPAKKEIRNRAVEVLKKYKNDDILLIAHSMGSIVAFDVLSFLMPDLKIDTFITIGSPLGLPVVMSKIVAEQKLKFKRVELKAPPGIKRCWFNNSELEDKVAMNYNLADDYDPNLNGVNAIDQTVCNNYEINGIRNPHKSFGYLRTPEMAKKIYDFVIYDKSKPAKWYLNISNKVLAKFTKLKKAAKNKLIKYSKQNESL